MIESFELSDDDYDDDHFRLTVGCIWDSVVVAAPLAWARPRP